MKVHDKQIGKKSIMSSRAHKIVSTKYRKISNWETYLDLIAKKKKKLGEKCILRARGVDVIYKTAKGPFKAVNNISFNLYEGEVLGLVGESGSGKSTLGKALTKQVEHKGKIFIEDLELPNKVSRVIRSDIVKKIQMIFQDPTDSLSPYKSVGKCLIEGLSNITKTKLLYWWKKTNTLLKHDEVKKMVSAIGFDQSLLEMHPLELSGGQQQRVSIGRALLVKPKILIADEPISALDVSIQAQVINIMNKLKRKRNLSILFIAHDLRMVEYISNRILVMNQGRIVESLPALDMNKKAIHPYTLTILSAVPSIDEFDVNLLKRRHDQNEYVITDDTYWWEVGADHYVLGNEKQIKKWLREKNQIIHKESLQNKVSFKQSVSGKLRDRKFKNRGRK